MLEVHNSCPIVGKIFFESTRSACCKVRQVEVGMHGEVEAIRFSRVSHSEVSLDQSNDLRILRSTNDVPDQRERLEERGFDVPLQ
jgi:hypothetical protein